MSLIFLNKLFYSISLLLRLALQKLPTQINDLLQSGGKLISNRRRKIPKRCLKRNTTEIKAVFLRLLQVIKGEHGKTVETFAYDFTCNATI